MRFFCAGVILVNNTIEVYERTRTIKSHCERFSMKNMPLPSSLPPKDTKYKNVWFTNLINTDDVKLVVDTKVLNDSVTLNTRVDKEPSFGRRIDNFKLCTQQSGY